MACSERNKEIREAVTEAERLATLDGISYAVFRNDDKELDIIPHINAVENSLLILYEALR